MTLLDLQNTDASKLSIYQIFLDILSMEESKPCQCPTSLQIPPDLSAPRVNMVGASPAGLHPVTLTDPGGLHLPQGPIQVIEKSIDKN